MAPRKQRQLLKEPLRGFERTIDSHPLLKPLRIEGEQETGGIVLKYTDSSFFTHSQADKIGVLITNLGTPDAPTKSALKRYLREFLSDPRVVEFPRFLWWLVLNGIILNVRPKRSAHAYQSVWTDTGSPLAIHTRAQAEALKVKFNDSWGDNLVFAWGMRYGNPSIASALEELLEQGVRKLLILPMYPQYSGSTTGSTFDAIAHNFTRRRWLPEFRFVNAYNKHPDYISALASTVQDHWANHGKPDLMVFSYHGVPLRYLHNGDPYHCQCHATSRLLAEKLGLPKKHYLTTFQSRFGREPWLRPYTDETLKELPGKGVKHIQVLCPGFSSDCLETIEEIGMENRDYFLEAGGEKYEYIPALNAQACHIDALAKIIQEQISGWEPPEGDNQAREAAYTAHEHNNK